VGARFLAQTLSFYLQGSDQDLTILVATSGDTGSAVASGFFNVPRIGVYVLYPSGKISPLQEQQITTLGNNVHALEVVGTFDDCQQLVKRALGDSDLVRARNLTTANSINVGRLLPQIAYYVWGIAQWQREYRSGTQEGMPVFVVPSGNFGNLAAGVYAKGMGAPIDRFIAATNVNDAGGEYLRSGSFVPRPAVQTYSNAMDVGNPSNVARLRSYFRNDHARLRRDIETARVTDDQTLHEIRLAFERTGRIVDPHTAVGIAAARAQSKSTPTIITATAHPGKFPDVIERALAVRIPLPEQLQKAYSRPKQSIYLSGDYGAFKRILMGRSLTNAGS
jgi:threonine synthase